MTPPQFGTILLLNGTSSSGKTSLVKALQTLLPEPFLDAGLDRFLWMLPKRYLDRPLWDDVLGLATEAGAAGRLLATGMHHAIAELSRRGCHVVADHVLVEPAWVEECARLFHDLPAWLVGVHCPLAVLEERERARRDRTLGQAAAQFPRPGVEPVNEGGKQVQPGDAAGGVLRQHHRLPAGAAAQVGNPGIGGEIVNEGQRLEGCLRAARSPASKNSSATSASIPRWYMPEHTTKRWRPITLPL